jgi:hypothetical protein
MAEVLRNSIGAELASDGVDAQIEPRFVLQPAESPCVDIYAGESARSSAEAAFGDISGAYVVTVRARVTMADDASAQDVLTDMVDDQHALSVAAALDEQTLDGWATFVYVDADGFSGLLDMSAVGRPMLGCTWRVLVGQAES